MVQNRIQSNQGGREGSQSLTAAYSNRLSKGYPAQGREVDQVGRRDDTRNDTKPDANQKSKTGAKAEITSEIPKTGGSTRGRIDKSSYVDMKDVQKQQFKKQLIEQAQGIGSQSDAKDDMAAGSAEMAAAVMAMLMPQAGAQPAGAEQAQQEANTQIAQQQDANTHNELLSEEMVQKAMQQAAEQRQIQTGQTEGASAQAGTAQQDVGIIEGFELQTIPGQEEAPFEPENQAEATQESLDHANIAAAADETKSAQNSREAESESGQETGAGQKKAEQSAQQSGQVRQDGTQPAQTAFGSQQAQQAQQSSAADKAEDAKPLATQLVDRITLDSTQASQKFTLQLKPEALGKVQIELVIDKDGLTAKIKTEDQAAKNAIVSEIQALQEGLKDKGIQIVKLDVIYEQSMQDLTQQNFTRQGDAQSGQRNMAHGINVQPQSFDTSAEVLMASMMYDTASVEYTA